MTKFLKVWSKFSAVTKKGGTVFNLRIEDMPESLTEDVLNVYMNCFIKQEATFKAAGVPKSTEALNEVRGPMFKALKEQAVHTVICCPDNGHDQVKDIIGASSMVLTNGGDPEPEYKYQTKEGKKLFEISNDLTAYFDEAKSFNLDWYYSDRGGFVRPEYKGLGIAQEFLRVRRMMCKERGIPIHGAWMTSYGSQKAAERDGWETVCEIRTEELGRKHGVSFVDDPPTFKFMIARIK